mmetsp:Transcript_22648/g.31620  ORF Transcript_22648/g.31620 Transcript_22648/m.31620 type:complete len:183 (+) Transcript_22648:176-724(+)
MVTIRLFFTMLALGASASAFVSPRGYRTSVAPSFAITSQQPKTSAFSIEAQQQQNRQEKSSLMMSSSEETKSNLPMLLDPGTKGGALFLSAVLFIVPIIVYQVVINVFGFDPIDAGKWIGVGFTFFTTVLWVSTYIFRVATKDMTYAKQLKDYENAVIAKRLEELDEDEIQALVEDIERDDF